MRTARPVGAPGVFAVRSALAAVVGYTLVGDDLDGTVEALTSLPQIPGYIELVQLVADRPRLIGEDRVVFVFG